MSLVAGCSRENGIGNSHSSAGITVCITCMHPRQRLVQIRFSGYIYIGGIFSLEFWKGLDISIILGLSATYSWSFSSASDGGWIYCTFFLFRLALFFIVDGGGF